ITTLPNAVDLAQFKPPSQSPASPYARPNILFIGQLVYRKGFDVLARAIPEVVQQFPNASFIFVSHNRQEEATLRAIVAQAGVDRHIHLLDNVGEAEKVHLLYGADVVVAPSRYEGFGIPIIEAMAAAR